MLSSFVKKLMFAREFDIADGKINVLGISQVMLPVDLLDYLQNTDKKNFYKYVKISVKRDIAAYAKKIGSNEEGLQKNISDIFETFGIGKMKLEDINNNKGTSKIRIDDSPFIQEHFKPNCLLTAGVLAGIFSFIFRKDVDCKEVRCISAKADYCEFMIK